MKLPNKVKAYIAIILLLAVVAAVTVFMLCESDSIDLFALLFWGMLAILTESLVLKLPSGMGLSVSFSILLAAFLSNGPAFAVLVTTIGFLFRFVRDKDSKRVIHFFNTPLYKSFFNAAQSVLAISLSGMVFIFLGGDVSEPFNFLLAVEVVMVYTMVNSIVMSLFFSLLKKQPFSRIWLSNVKGIFLNVILVGILGVIIFLAFDSYGYGAVVLFLGPLLLARFSFKQYNDLRGTYLDTIKAFNELTEAKDSYTGQHSSRVETYAVKLAEHMKLPEKKINDIRMAAVLHDIGKIGIDDNIIRKPDSLTDEEYAMIKKHPEIGADIINKVHFLKDVSQIIRHHHERYDGRGYPGNISGDKISTEAAILAIADTYDAITSDRTYRDPLTFEQAKKEIADNAGTQFDPEIAKKFLEAVDLNEEVFNRDAY